MKNSGITMCYLTTPRERITPKDIMKIMGYEKNKAYRYYNRIRSAKTGPSAEIVIVDDLASFTGISRDAIKSSLAR